MSINLGSTVRVVGDVADMSAAQGMEGVVVERFIDDTDSNYDSYTVRLPDLITTDNGGRIDWLVAGPNQLELVASSVDGTVPELKRDFLPRDYVEVNSPALNKQGVRGIVNELDPYGRRFMVTFDEEQTYSNVSLVEEDSRGQPTEAMTVEPSEATLVRRIPYGPDFDFNALNEEDRNLVARTFITEMVYRGIPREALPPIEDIMLAMSLDDKQAAA